MSTKVKVSMEPVNALTTKLGVSKDGNVQRFVTNTINRRIGRYMPHLTGVLETKLKHVTSPTEITVDGPYARVTYYGKVMVDPVTGAAGFQDRNGQWKSRKGIPKVESNRNMNYTKTFNPAAGPFYDRALMAAEGKQIIAKTQNYIKRRAGKK